MPASRPIAPLLAGRRTIKILCRLITPALVFVGSWQTDSNQAIGVMLFLAGLVGPVLIVAITLRRPPSRVLLLRPFGEREISSNLKRFAKRYLSPLGLAFTLADLHMTPPGRLFSLWKGFLELGGLLLAWLRPAHWHVATQAELLEFERLLQQGSRRSAFHWIWSRSGLIAIRTSDSFWQDVVRRLMERVDLIVIDLSDAGPGSVWELGQLRRVDVSRRVICVAVQGKLALAQEMVDKLLPPGASERFFGYTAEGVVMREAQFFDAMASIVLASRLPPAR